MWTFEAEESNKLNFRICNYKNENVSQKMRFSIIFTQLFLPCMKNEVHKYE
jgi:hypothetical protein